MKSFNGISMLMVGNNTYNKNQMEEFFNGFNRTDPNLLNAVNSQWAKLRDYAALGGTPESDEWGQDCNQPPRGELWMEKNCTVQQYGNMSIWEPCNYASNLAYYHSFLETCSKNHNWSFPIKSKNAICKTFALLGFASSFFHATQTDNGGIVDVRVIDMIFFVAYQETVSFLKTSKQSIVKELSVEKRNQPAVEIIDDMMNMFVDKPISKWGSILTNYDYPNINIGIAALVGVIISLIMPLHPKEGELIMNSTLSIMNLFEHRINSTDVKFYEEEFIPAIIDSTADMRKVLPTMEVKTLFKNSVGVMIKFVFAILYQEQTIQNEDFLKYWQDDWGNTFSNFIYNFLPMINNLASSLTSFGDTYSRKDFQSGTKFYPGEEVCNKGQEGSPFFLHPIWHLETAIAFPDLAFLADDTHRIIKLYGTKKYPILTNNGEELWIQSYRRSSHIKHSSGMKNVKNISKGSKTENIKSIVPLVEYFRGIGWLMTGNQEYNKTFLEDLEITLYQLGTPSTKDLTKSIVAQWEKIKQYAASGGNPPIDAWKRCNDTFDKPEQTEKNCTFLEHDKIPIWEPCNYASSIPFFHSTIEMSKNGRLWSMPKQSKHAIGKALASVGLISSFYHASQTKNAEDCDNRVIDLIMFVLYQSAVDNLWTNSTKSIIRDLDEEGRNETANDMVDFAMNMYVETPIAEWGATLNEYDFPSVYRSGIALFLLAFNLVLPPYQFNNFVIRSGLSLAITKNIITKEDGYFLSTLNDNVEAITENITLPEEEAKKLFNNLVGVIIKLFYALLWNDNAISEIISINALMNEIGYEIMPLINDLVNTMTSFQLSDTDFQEGRNLYPGEELCNKGGSTGDNPHPKWHVQMAILVPDVVYLSDEIHRIITTYGKF